MGRSRLTPWRKAQANRKRVNHGFCLLVIATRLRQQKYSRSWEVVGVVPKTFGVVFKCPRLGGLKVTMGNMLSGAWQRAEGCWGLRRAQGSIGGDREPNLMMDPSPLSFPKKASRRNRGLMRGQDWWTSICGFRIQDNASTGKECFYLLGLDALGRLHKIHNVVLRVFYMQGDGLDQRENRCQHRQ